MLGDKIDNLSGTERPNTLERAVKEEEFNILNRRITALNEDVNLKLNNNVNTFE
jgi:hypothetical protein